MHLQPNNKAAISNYCKDSLSKEFPLYVSSIMPGLFELVLMPLIKMDLIMNHNRHGGPPDIPTYQYRASDSSGNRITLSIELVEISVDINLSLCLLCNQQVMLGQISTNVTLHT